MNRVNKNKRVLIFLVLISVVLLLIFLYLVFRSVSSTNIFTDIPSGSSDREGVYLTPDGEKIFYDPKYLTPEDIEKEVKELMEEGEHFEE